MLLSKTKNGTRIGRAEVKFRSEGWHDGEVEIGKIAQERLDAKQTH